MTSHSTLLSDIEAFLSETGMNESAFGHKTVNDGKFVDRVRQGGGVTLKTADKVRAFMADHRRSRKRPDGGSRAVA